MRRFVKIILCLSLLTAVLWGVGRLYFKWTDGFSLGQITPQTYQIDEHQDLFSKTDEQLKEVDFILQQPYHYLGKGSQSYAFRSEDGQYVIKFVKQKHLSSSYVEQFLFSLPGMEDLRQQKIAKYKKRWDILIHSALLAEKYLKNETRLVYVHFYPTENKLPALTIYDKVGLSYQIDTDLYQFYIQKYMLVLREALTSWDDEKIKIGLSHVIDALLLRSAKGIQEDDCLILDNMGFIGLEPVFLDIGRLKQRDDLHNPKVSMAVLRCDLEPITKFLKDHRPELVDWWEKIVNEKIKNDFNILFI